RGGGGGPGLGSVPSVAGPLCAVRGPFGWGTWGRQAGTTVIARPFPDRTGLLSLGSAAGEGKRSHHGHNLSTTRGFGRSKARPSTILEREHARFTMRGAAGADSVRRNSRRTGDWCLGRDRAWVRAPPDVVARTAGTTHRVVGGVRPARVGLPSRGRSGDRFVHGVGGGCAGIPRRAYQGHGCAAEHGTVGGRGGRAVPCGLGRAVGRGGAPVTASSVPGHGGGAGGGDRSGVAVGGGGSVAGAAAYGPEAGSGGESASRY